MSFDVFNRHRNQESKANTLADKQTEIFKSKLPKRTAKKTPDLRVEVRLAVNRRRARLKLLERLIAEVCHSWPRVHCDFVAVGFKRSKSLLKTRRLGFGFYRLRSS
jgi:hypothetical protein